MTNGIRTVGRREVCGAILGAVTGGMVFGPIGRAQAQAASSAAIIDGGEANRNGLNMRHLRSGRLSPFLLIESSGNHGRAMLDRGDIPCVALAGRGGDFPYEVAVHCPRGSGSMDLTFGVGTPYGGFSIRRNERDYVVRLSVSNGGEVWVFKRPNWSTPVMHAYAGRGDFQVTTGNLVIASENEEIRALSGRVAGGPRPYAIPFEVRIEKRNGRISTHAIRRDGSVQPR